MNKNESKNGTKQNFFERHFQLTKNKTTIKTEIFAGVTLFFSMCYILMVNAGMLSEVGPSYGAIYIATAISAVMGTMLIGLLSNLPLAQASGMGLNAFFVYTVCFSLGFSYGNALVLVLVDGIVFIILTATGLRKKIFEAIPACVKSAINPGIGLFIAFLGFQDSGFIVSNDSTCVSLASFNFLNNGWSDIFPLLVFLATFFIIVVLAKKKVKASVIIGILAGTALYYLIGFITIPNFYDTLGIELQSPIAAFDDFFNQSFLTVFKDGFNFSAYIEQKGVASFILIIVTTSLAFCLVDMFDTLGTLYGTCEIGGMLDEKGDVPNMNKAMLSDAIATTVGAVCGTSTVTTFSESATAVAAGGRTGLTSVVTALLFLVAMFLSPIAQLMSGYATAAALVYVGVLMMGTVKSIDWKDLTIAVPAFITMALMPLTYNISYGIAFGLISYIVMTVFTGKIKDIKITTWVISGLFIAMLFLTH